MRGWRQREQKAPSPQGWKELGVLRGQECPMWLSGLDGDREAGSDQVTEGTGSIVNVWVLF